MNKKLLIKTSILVLLIILSFCVISVSAEDEGVTFTATDYYKSHLAVSTPPLTFEAVIQFPRNTETTSIGGVILGNYKNSSTPCVNFEIHKNGSPKLLMIDENKKQYSFIFDKVSVYTGKPVHIAITQSSAKNTVTCYLNGKAVQTIEAEFPAKIALETSTPLILGGDYRKDNSNYFKGTVFKFAMYSKVRSAEQIALDAQGNYGTDGLIGYYIADKSKKNLESVQYSSIRFIHTEPWIEKEPAKDYAYSFAVIGDTQILTQTYPKTFTKIYDWIIENAKEKNIKYVFGLGDITNGDTMGEWVIAKKFMTSLNGVVPYSIVRGNHDSAEQFNRYFPYSEFGSTVDGSFDGTMLNTYKIFSVGKVKYMVMSLEHMPTKDVLKWADGIVSQNPDCNVIITTHGYLYQNNVKVSDIWQEVARKYENICMVISGHDPCDLIVTQQSKGNNGNIVTEFLVDGQNADRFTKDGIGFITMFYFSEDGKHLEVECISAKTEKYYLEENQFTIELDVVEVEEETEAQTAPAEITSPEESLPENNDTVSINDKKQDNTLVIIVSSVISVAVIAAIAIIVIRKKKG